MPAIVLCFQVHHAPCLVRCNAFHAPPPPGPVEADPASGPGPGWTYLDANRDTEQTRRLADRCYLPATERLLRLIELHRGDFRLALAVSGPALTRFQATCPEMIQRLRRLAQTGCCEFLGQSAHHSLACFFDPEEFARQVEMHQDQVERVIGPVPRVLCPAEMIGARALASALAALGRFTGCLADAPSTWADASRLTLLPRSVPLSRALIRCLTIPPAPAERSLARAIQRLADRVHEPEGDDDAQAAAPPPVRNLVIPMARLDAHRRAPGIDPLDALEQWVQAILSHGASLITPSEAIERLDGPAGPDTPPSPAGPPAGDGLSDWTDNAMQSDAMDKLYRLGAAVKAHEDDPALVADWRSLTTSDHVRLMRTDAAEADPLSPPAPAAAGPMGEQTFSPYDQYINFMNILDHLAQRAGRSDITNV